MSAASFLHSSFLPAISAVMLWLVHVQKVPQASITSEPNLSLNSSTLMLSRLPEASQVGGLETYMFKSLVP